MCGLTLAWVTSENSTSTGMPISFDSIFFAGPYLVSYCLRSRPHLSVVPRQLFCWLASMLSRRQLPASSFVQPTLFRVLLPLPDTARFQVPKILCLVSRLNRQRNRLLGPPIQCYGLFIAKSFLHIYIKYMISKHILLITFLNEPELITFAHS